MDILKNRYKNLIIKVLLIGGLLALVCLIQIIKPNKTYNYGGEEYLGGNGVEVETVVYRKIALPPGVYRVKMDFQAETDLEYLCSVKDGTVIYNGLKSNGEHLYAGKTQTDFLFWLYEGTEELQIVIEGAGNTILHTGNLKIEETNQLWTLLLTNILYVVILIIILIYWKAYDRNIGITKDSKNIVYGIIIIVFLSSIPYMYDSIISGSDLTYHLQRIEGVKDGLLCGQFPVRLEPKWVNGHGYANGIFYCNLLLYFPAILRILGFTVNGAYINYCIMLNVLTANISYYSYNKIFQNKYIGLGCSALYTLSIFKFNKLVLIGAVGESSAFAFLPLIIYGFYRVFTEDINDKKYNTVWIPLTLGFAGIIQTHVLTCEITTFLTVILCLLMIKKCFQLKTFLQLVKGAMGAVILSIWYLVPFLDYYISENLLIKNVSGRTIQSRGLELWLLITHFWTKIGESEESDRNYYDAEGVGFVIVLGAIVFTVIWFCGKWKNKKEPQIKMGKIALIFGTSLMAMSLKIFPWDTIQSKSQVAATFISSIQWPNRFLGWATALLVVVCGCCIWYYEQKENKIGYYICVAWIMIAVVTSYMFIADYACRDQRVLTLYNEEGMGRGYISGAEYLIMGTDKSILTYKDPLCGENIKLIEYEKGDLSVTFKCMNEGNKESYVEFPLLHYKGYQSEIVETGEKLQNLKGDNNIVRVIIPAGFSGEASVRFESLWYWRVAEIISLVGTMIIFYKILKGIINEKRNI